MKCDACKEAEAKVHLTQIVNGVMQKVDLCEDCAKTKGVSDPAGFSLADLFLGLGQSEIFTTPPSTTELRCPSCGMTQNDFKKSGRLGCSRCYQVFAHALASLIKSMHKGTQHIGKHPTGQHVSKTSSEEHLTTLKQDLEKAIKTENFETAAELRDLIRKIEDEIYSHPKN